MIAQAAYLIVLILVFFLITYVAKHTSDAGKEDMFGKCLAFLEQLIQEAVLSTNQTFVDDLKTEGAFDKDAQTDALNITKSKIEDCLTSTMKKILSYGIDNLDTFISQKIEATIKSSK